MVYRDDELWARGSWLQTEWLVDWAKALAKSASRDLPTLKKFGVDQKLLNRINELAKEVNKLSAKVKGERKLAKAMTIAQNMQHAKALDWWHTAKGIALLAYESEPDKLIQFRTSVRVSQSVTRLAKEIDALIPLFEKYVKC